MHDCVYTIIGITLLLIITLAPVIHVYLYTKHRAIA